MSQASAKARTKKEDSGWRANHLCGVEFMADVLSEVEPPGEGSKASQSDSARLGEGTVKASPKEFPSRTKCQKR